MDTPVRRKAGVVVALVAATLTLTVAVVAAPASTVGSQVANLAGKPPVGTPRGPQIGG